jgi:hypothetical protein
LAKGDKNTGISIIDVHPSRMDGGDVLSQEPHALSAEGVDTYASLEPVLAEQGARQLVEVLRDLPRARKSARRQSDMVATQEGSTTTTETAVVPASASPSLAPRIPKSAGQLLFSRHGPESLARIYAALQGFMPVWSTLHGERLSFTDILTPRQVEAAKHKASTQQQQMDTTNNDSAHLPTLAEAQALGPGGLFYSPELQALGVICAGSTVEQPQVLYVRGLHYAGKARAVDARTFALGYLDKRRVKDPELRRAWKLLSTEEGPAGGKPVEDIDWWANKL